MFDPLEYLSRVLSFLDRHRGGTALVIATGLSLGLHAAGRDWSPQPLRQAMDISVGTLQTGASTALAFLNIWIWKENHDLRTALMKERVDRVRLDEVMAENSRLRLQLGFSPPPTFQSVPCLVLSLDAEPLGGSLTVDRGNRHGLVGGEAVMSVDGLVGSVAEVFPSRSRVRLLTHYESPVSVRVMRNRVLGIVEWDPVSGHHFLRNVPVSEDVAAGDTLISSGLGGVYPEGLYVGRVDRIGEQPMGLVQEVFVTAGARFNALEELFILRPAP